MNKKITISQLQQIIKEGVARLHRQTLIENRIKQINKELRVISESHLGSSTKDIIDRYLASSVSTDFDNNKIYVELDDLDSVLVYRIDVISVPSGTVSDPQDEVDGEIHLTYLPEESNIGNADVENYSDYISSEIYFNPGKYGIWDSYEPDGPDDYRDRFDDMMGNPLDNMDFLGEGEVMGQEEYEILESYLEAALWTEEEEIGHASVSEVSDDSREKANQDVLEFMSKAGSLLDGIEPSQVGHDLWLTRNGHGAGFWDRGLGEVGDQLSEIASAMGTKYAYRGDDNLIYIE